MDRKLVYITLQKMLAERYPAGPKLNAWMEWLDAVYAGDVKRPPPDVGPATLPVKLPIGEAGLERSPGTPCSAVRHGAKPRTSADRPSHVSHRRLKRPT